MKITMDNDARFKAAGARENTHAILLSSGEATKRFPGNDILPKIDVIVVCKEDGTPVIFTDTKAAAIGLARLRNFDIVWVN